MPVGTLEDQVTAPIHIVPFKRLSMPAREGKAVARKGLLSTVRPPFAHAAMPVNDGLAVIPSNTPRVVQPGEPASLYNHATVPAQTPGTIPFTPKLAPHYEPNRNAELLNAPYPTTIPLTPQLTPQYEPGRYTGVRGDPFPGAIPFTPRLQPFSPVPGEVYGALPVVVQPEQGVGTPAILSRRSSVRDLPHLVFYLVGAGAIFALYLLIPLLILLHATLPAGWNTFSIALGALLGGELLIFSILSRTTSGKKARKR